MIKSTVRQPGFTLIELLVVIAIISIIAAILFPVFSTAREKARQNTCSSNLKQLGIAFQQYASDYDESFPTGLGYGGISIGWAGQLSSYVKNTGVFDCPDDQTAPQTRTVNGTASTLTPVSYAYNDNLGTPISGQTVWTLSQLTAPSSTILLYEVTGRRFSTPSDPCSYNVADLTTTNEAGGAYNGVDSCYSPAGIGTQALNSAASYIQQATGYSGGSQQSALFTPFYFTGPNGRHTNGSNWLASDGHVKWLLGSSVSTGNYYGPKYLATASTPTVTENQYYGAGLYGQAAGTAVPGWAMTFSPV
ncbi:MAG: DUF1559 domain-containing protein [Capsulimonadaceae bacterium]|nr:DUF1559 domain-containing protein [Capsulimonadaceae bacterium]